MGHLFGEPSETRQWTDDSWKSRLKRVRKTVKDNTADAQTKKKLKKKRQATEKTVLRQRLSDDGLDEQEFVADLGGWTVKVLLWLPTMQAAISQFPNFNEGMQLATTAAFILEGLGCGHSFVNQLVLQTFQFIGCCDGVIAKLGTGTYKVANKLCNMNVNMFVMLFQALGPTLIWMARRELRSTWVVLCTFAGFQLFQSLLFEKRRLEDETRDKREGRADPLNCYPEIQEWSWSVSGTLWSGPRVILERSWGLSGILEWFWGDSGVVLGCFWNGSGMVLG